MSLKLIVVYLIVKNYVVEIKYNYGIYYYVMTILKNDAITITSKILNTQE